MDCKKTRISRVTYFKNPSHPYNYRTTQHLLCDFLTLIMTKMDRSDPPNPLEIPELLEEVLLHLGQRRILLLQRVSRFWFNTIFGSPKLQQKLFFQPLPPSKAAQTSPQFNPLVEELFPFLFAAHPCPGTHICKNITARCITNWTWKLDRRQAVLRPEASWRRMLPVQPAASIEGVMVADWRGNMDEFGKNSLEWCQVDCSRHASALGLRSNLGDNATMGLLYDIIFYKINSSAHPGVYVQWNMFRFPQNLQHDYRRHRPISWTHFTLFEQIIMPYHYRNVEPRNTITIHVSKTNWLCGSACQRSVDSTDYPTDLRVLLDLPAGVLQEGSKANRYPLANLFSAYEIFGRIAPEARSELDIEQGQRPEPDEEREVRYWAQIL